MYKGVCVGGGLALLELFHKIFKNGRGDHPLDPPLY